MAVLCSSTPFTPLKKPWPTAKPVDKAWMLQTRTRSLSAKLQIRSSMKNNKSYLVYEDQSEGVICYTNEDGETICEGYDEGPRYRRETLKTVDHSPRTYAEQSDLVLLRRCWLQIFREELNQASKAGVALKVDGSNTK